ncbi:hypothetical protein WICPIJ_009976 [Wickerhamomyces pijperi]|uniref:Uncharacterized protein n=1 Tax=Wickerhamomyces pijperi TaxID=599730 RepID=A0A9P8PJH1_WICPI|nr:hypothetical protein WICPIJ_009976 [Wickerhamomyces pijperi]
MMYSSGKCLFNSLVALITGPSGSSALEPTGSLQPGASGTPNRITALRPLSTNPLTKGISLLTPHLFCFGKDSIKTSSSSLSEMNNG